MNKQLFRYLLLLVSFIGTMNIRMSGQENVKISLGYCQSQAIANYPSSKDKSLIQAVSALKINNIDAGRLPQIVLNGQATYQSEAIDISLPTPGGVKNISQAKDQYKATLDINQLLYDGGTLRYQRNLEESSLGVDTQQVDVDLIKVKEQVNNVYFLLLSLQENKRLLNTTLDEIKERKGVVSSSVQNGVLTSSDLDVLDAEQLNIEQQLAEIDINRKTSLNILSILVSKPMSDSLGFELPIMTLHDSIVNYRPEYKLFELQSKQIDNRKQLTGSLLKPKIYAFAEGGYGRPGLNMLSNEFSGYYILGASFKWTLWDWHKNSRDCQELDIQKQMVDNRRETFEKNMNIDLQNRLSSIQKLEESLQRDYKIVELRSRIAQVAASRLENGVITSTDYLSELNAETIAKINLETHKIQLVQAKANYLLAMGNM